MRKIKSGLNSDGKRRVTMLPCHEPPHNADETGERLTDIEQWRCLNCGQLVFVAAGAEPPDICQYCDDMTTWQPAER